MAAKSKEQVYTQAQIDELVQKKGRSIVVFESQVYDWTEFKQTHPGGPKLIDDLVGKDITEEFYDAEHSKIALRLLSQLKIGRISENIDDNHTNISVVNNERMKEIEGEEWRKLIDPTKGTIYQVFTKMDLKSYMHFVNDPKHMTKPGEKMRMFDNNILEFFSCTPWYHVGIFWFPIVCYKIWESTYDGMSPAMMLFTFILGMFTWTFTEYALHRFVFHMELYIPDNRFCITLHYILHGVHHAFPMDEDRLVFPIAMAIPMYKIVFFILCLVYPSHMCNLAMAGLVFMYLGYDMGHYYLHHSDPHKFVEYRKKYHMYHHYKDPDNGYGITTSFWDKVFGTELDLDKKVTKAQKSA